MLTFCQLIQKKKCIQAVLTIEFVVRYNEIKALLNPESSSCILASVYHILCDGRCTTNPPHVTPKPFPGPHHIACTASTVNANTINPPVSWADFSPLPPAPHNWFFYSLFFTPHSPANEKKNQPRPAKSAAICDNKQRGPVLHRLPIFSPACACFL